MPTELNKYFIAIVFENPLQKQITDFKDHVKQHFESSGALRAPAHITLQMPFEWKIKKRDALLQALQTFATAQQSFEIELYNFDFFEPRVVFIDVIENGLLINLQKELQTYLKQHLQLFEIDGKHRGFHPHVTIGFRDLKKPQFYAAQKYFIEQSFYAQTKCNSISLLKHDGKVWAVEGMFGFS